MLYPTATRDWNGVHIAGQRIGLRLHPDDEGRISVAVIGMPEVTGFDGPCRLSDDERTPSFAPPEIWVHDTRLECFAANRYAPVLREGFTLELEPGMAPLLRDWMVKLTAVAAGSKAIADQFNVALPPPIHHMLFAVTSVVARIVLDGWEISHSVDFERMHGTWASNHEFMAQFEADGVRQALRALVSTASATATGDVAKA